MEKGDRSRRLERGISKKAAKKGDFSKCSKYRGITFISIPGKVLNRVILNCMKEYVDPLLRGQQARSRKG
jgi:hypothetical protein